MKRRAASAAAGILLLIASTACPVHAGHAGEDSASVGTDGAGCIGDDFAGAWRDAGSILSAPLRFNAEEWAQTGLLLGGTAALMAADQAARSGAADIHAAAPDAVFDVGREYGREIYGLAASGGLYAGGLLFRSRECRETGLMLFEAIALSGIVTNFLKSAAGRSRPYEEEGAFRYRGFQFKVGTTSLPSGHATVAFAVSSVLAERTGSLPLRFGLYGLAAVTAASRVYHDDHWLSDSFLGSVIGFVVGRQVARLHSAQKGEGGLVLMPRPGGLAAALTF